MIEVLLVKPTFIPHETYHNFVIDQLQKHYSGGILVLINDDWPVIMKLWISDLSGITASLADLYGSRGPAPRDPTSMVRAYLLLFLTNPTMGITKWVAQLKRVPLYAVLSGFEPADVPGVGTFYDLFPHLWDGEVKSLANRNPKVFLLSWVYLVTSIN